MGVISRRTALRTCLGIGATGGLGLAYQQPAFAHHADKFAYRLLTLGVDQPTPGREEEVYPLSSPAPLSEQNNSWTSLSTNPDGSAITWSPCRPIHYVVRPDRQPTAGMDVIHEAFDDLAAATGLVFIFDGLTDEAPSQHRAIYQPHKYGDRWAPVLVAWSDAVDYPDLTGDVVGITRSTPVRQGAVGHYVSAQVVLGASELNEQTVSVFPSTQSYAKAVIGHELGHLVGLGHVQDPTQLMNPQLNGDVFRYQAGDLTGLAHLGTGSCTVAI